MEGKTNLKPVDINSLFFKKHPLGKLVTYSMGLLAAILTLRVTLSLAELISSEELVVSIDRSVEYYKTILWVQLILDFIAFYLLYKIYNIPKRMKAEYNNDTQVLRHTTRVVMLYSSILSIILILWQITHSFAATFTFLTWVVIAIPIMSMITMFITNKRVVNDPDYIIKISKRIS